LAVNGGFGRKLLKGREIDGGGLLTLNPPIRKLNNNQSNPFASRYSCGFPHYLQFFDLVPFCAFYSDNFSDSCTIYVAAALDCHCDSA
jgi:hypothetical protein